MKLLKLILIVLTITPFVSIACPTCVARIQKESPAFFNEDFYTMTPASQTQQIDEDIDSQREDNE